MASLPLPLSLLLLTWLSASGSVSGTRPGQSPGANTWTRGFEAPRESFLETVLEGNVANQKSCKPTGLIQDACCDYQTVEDVNEDMAVRLADVIKLPFFRYQKVDLFRECPYWHEDGSCMNRACAVQETEEEAIPEAWRSGTLGQVKEASSFSKDLEGALFRDEDFCVLDEDSMNSDGVYVDLHENPERFTGYAGPSANKVWKAIYEENCFDVVPFLPPSRSSESGGSGYVGTSLLQDKSKGFRSLVGNLGLEAPKDPQDAEQCLEKRVYYRIISGLHASISIHICAEYLDQTSGEWRPNLECFITRIAEHPERLQNVYFNYVLMLRALRKAAPYLRAYNYTTGNQAIDSATQQSVTGLLDRAESCSATFDETSMFSGVGADQLKVEFKEHFRNVSRIMDCVGCDKCRLWGKTQVTGVATALKLLFSFDENATPATSAASSAFSLKRSEIVAFIWTLHRFSESLAAVEEFRKMWAKRNSLQSVNEQVTSESSAGKSTKNEQVRAKDTEESAVKVVPSIVMQEVDAAIDVDSKKCPNADDNLSTPTLQPGRPSNAVGPRLHSFLERIVGACRSSFAACFAIVEWGVSLLAGSSGGKSEL